MALFPRTNIGPHQEYIDQFEVAILYITWWMGLGMYYCCCIVVDFEMCCTMLKK
jgi:hypothetical protein